MKRYGNLFHQIACPDNLKLAFAKAAEGKEHYLEVAKALSNKAELLDDLHQLLLTKSFTCGKYTKFPKQDKGKLREIHKLPFYPDRIIQHAILQVLSPIWDKSLIPFTYQSIKGRGVHLCLKQVKRAVQVQGVRYCLQIDVKKFYPSINNQKLKLVIRKKIKCKDTLWVLDAIIDGAEGIPIGNYISQYFGNLYLSETDHRIKDQLKIKHYYRYCDDLILMSNSKDELWDALTNITRWLEAMDLCVKENYQVYKITATRGVNCFGYTVHPKHTRVRKSIANNFKGKVKHMIKLGEIHKHVIGSYYGWFKHADSAALWWSITSPLKGGSITDTELQPVYKFTHKLRVRHAHRRI